MTTLKDLWVKYRSLPWWKQLLLILPGIVILVLVIVLLAMGKSDEIDNLINYQREQIDSQVNKNEKKDNTLAATENKLKKQAEQIKNEVKTNEQNTKETIDSIDNAVSRGDLDELERIRTKLNNR